MEKKRAKKPASTKSEQIMQRLDYLSVQVRELGEQVARESEKVADYEQNLHTSLAQGRAIRTAILTLAESIKGTTDYTAAEIRQMNAEEYRVKVLEPLWQGHGQPIV